MLHHYHSTRGIRKRDRIVRSFGRTGVRGLSALPERAPGDFWCLLVGQKARVVRAATAGPTISEIGVCEML